MHVGGRESGVNARERERESGVNALGAGEWVHATGSRCMTLLMTHEKREQLYASPTLLPCFIGAHVSPVPLITPMFICSAAIHY
jgi:hypothetical protein